MISSLQERFPNLNGLIFFEALIFSLALTFAIPSLQSILLGLVTTLMGMSFRIWTRGFHLRPSEGVFGPYRFVRHPHQLGTFLVFLGLCLASRSYWLTGLMILGSLLTFRTIFKEEERMGGGRKGVLYRDYRLRVPTFIPNLLPYSGPLLKPIPFSLRTSLMKRQRGEWHALAISTMVYILLYGLSRSEHPEVWQLIVGPLVFLGCMIPQFTKQKL